MVGLKTCEITQEEISYLNNTFENPNDKKNFIQNKFNDSTIRNKFSLTLLPTGLGKTISAVKLIKRIRKVTNEKIIVVVPTSDLKNSWLFQTKEIENVEIHVLNSFTLKEIKYECHTLIVDEVHTISNQDSRYFSTVLDIVDRKYTCLLTATLEKKHLEFLTKKGLQVVNKADERICRQLDIVPMNETINVPIELTTFEKLEYYKIQKEIEAIGDYFKSLGYANQIFYLLPQILSRTPVVFEESKMLGKNIAEIFAQRLILEGAVQEIPLNKLIGIIYRKAINYLSLIKRRADILQKAENKFKVLDLILEEESKPAYIFCSSIETLNRIQRADVVSFHSKQGKKERKKNLEEFIRNVNYSISSVKGINLGFDLKTKCLEFNLPVKDVSLVINFSGNSSSIDNDQRFGRAKRLSEDKDKIAKMYNLFVNDFKIGDEIIESQEKKWLKKATKNNNFVKFKKYNI